jgi:NADH dehydrogenase FAD-containing subunit
MNNSQYFRIFFVGGGHAHLYSLKHADELIQQGAHVSLIGPERYHYYSGMGPGMLSRIYEPHQARVDIQKLTLSRGVNFIRGLVKAIDPAKKTLFLESGETHQYDIVSFNIGSYVPSDLIPGSEKEAFTVKPIENLESLREKILALIQGSIPRLLVVGAGPAGVELSGNIWRLLNENRGEAEIILAGSEDTLLPRFPKKAGLLARKSLMARGVTVLTQCMITSMDRGIARTQNREELAYDTAVLTIGIQPKNVFDGSGIETAPNGSLLVNSFLQSTSHPEIFAGGDCITFKERPLDMVGVYAVRQAPVLFNNICASIQGNPLKKFVPQKKYLLIFNLGDSTGILVRNPIILRSRWFFSLKDRIDRRFISQFQI